MRTMTTESARNACLARYFPRPLRLAEPLQHRRDPFQAAPLVLHRSADSSPVVGDGNMTTINKNHRFTHVSLASLAGAPPLDARRLQTFANTGDCAAWVKRNPGVDERCGTNVLLITAVDLQTRDTADTPRDVRRNMWRKHDAHTSLRTTRTPDVARRCSQRCVVDTGTPSAAAIFLLPKPRVAMHSMAKRSSSDRTMLL